MCVCVHLCVGMANLSAELMGNDDAGEKATSPLAVSTEKQRVENQRPRFWV